MPGGTLTVALLLVLVFAAQLAGARLPTADLFGPTVPDLVAMGALNPDLVWVCGDWWRLFLAPLLHGNAVHLGLNLAVLLYAGSYVERRLDGWSLAGLLAAGGLAGALASVAWLPADRVGIGASGGIMALVACAAALSYAWPQDEGRRAGRLLNILVLSLIPHESGVDYAAHFGGAVMGGLVALATCVGGPPQAGDPARRRAGALAALGFLGCALFGAVALARMGPAYDPAWRLLTPRSAADLERADLRALRRARREVPGDPRLAFDLARAAALAGDRAEGAREALAGLRLLRTLGAEMFPPALVGDLKLVLALARQRPAGALCTAAGDRALKAALRREGLCPPVQ